MIPPKASLDRLAALATLTEAQSDQLHLMLWERYCAGAADGRRQGTISTLVGGILGCLLMRWWLSS